MTKVQKHFRLLCELDEALLARIADANSVYGIERIILPQGGLGQNGGEIIVEYDATRLRAANVESVLGRVGIPVAEVANA